jgi:hypothetical protein
MLVRVWGLGLGHEWEGQPSTDFGQSGFEIRPKKMTASVHRHGHALSFSRTSRESKNAPTLFSGDARRYREALTSDGIALLTEQVTPVHETTSIAKTFRYLLAICPRLRNNIRTMISG